jgi:hypothetical protein
MGKFQTSRPVQAIILLVCGIGALSGCVERRYTIRTDPPGATVVVNGEEIGPSPASKSFVYYGDRKISLILDGYETKTLIQPINAPWWDNYVTEFFTENVIPVSMRDERDYTYKLDPFKTTPQGELRDRAETLRSEARVLPKPRRGGILAWFGFTD